MQNAVQLAEQPAKVLIVEDEEYLRETMAYRFEKEGFSVYVAQDGVEAMDIIVAELPDIILTDVRMPRMNGKELLREIRNKYAHGNIPIIFCITGYSDLSEREAADLWVDRFFHKPFDPAVLVAASRADLDKMRSRLRLRNSYLSFIKDQNFEGFMAAAMMHEINNMLNVGSFSAVQLRQHFEKYIPDPTVAKAIGRIESVFTRMQGVTRLLNAALRDHDAIPERVAVTAVLKHVLDEAQSRFQECEFEIANECPDSVELLAVPFAPQITLVNLVKNAFEAMPSGQAKINIDVKIEGSMLAFYVSNPGSIADITAAKIFDPFFTTKNGEEGQGMGIGLAIARKLVQESGGELTLAERKERTVFKVTFPLVT